jgi:hypothetical protein
MQISCRGRECEWGVAESGGCSAGAGREGGSLPGRTEFCDTADWKSALGSGWGAELLIAG